MDSAVIRNTKGAVSHLIPAHLSSSNSAADNEVRCRGWEQDT